MRWFLAFLALTVAAMAAAAFVGINKPVHDDETHFQKAIRRFSGPLTVDKLRTYPAHAAPLSFWLFAKVGDAAGYEPWKLRLVSLIFTAAACLAFYAALARVAGPRGAFFAAALLLFNPYLLRLCCTFYTDMPAMFLLAAALALMVRGRLVGACLCAAAMAVSRQYFLTLPLAGAAVYLGQAATHRDGRARALAAAAGFAASLVPLGLLVLLWGGAYSPGAPHLRGAEEPLFHPMNFTPYVAMLAVYIAPLVLWRRRAIYGSWIAWAAAVPVSAVYLVYPIATAAAWADHSEAIGVFHHMAQVVSGGHAWIEHALLYAAFLAGLPVLFFFLRDIWLKLRARAWDVALFLDIQVLLFLALMLTQVNIWEKYFLPVVPILVLRLMMSDAAATAEKPLREIET